MMTGNRHRHTQEHFKKMKQKQLFQHINVSKNMYSYRSP